MKSWAFSPRRENQASELWSLDSWTLHQNGLDRGGLESTGNLVLVCGADFPISEVGILHPGLLVLGPHFDWAVVTGIARAAEDAQALRRVLLWWELGIQPGHVRGEVVPDRHRKDQTPCQGLAHGGKAALLLVVVVILKGLLLLIAEAVGDGVTRHVGNRGLGVLNQLAILHIEAADLNEFPRVGAIVGQKLSHHCQWLHGVYLEILPRAIEAMGSHAVGVQVATIFVAEALPALTILPVAALNIACATDWPDGATRMRRVGRGPPICLPNIHFHATDSQGGIGFKLFVRTLCITVARAKLGTGCVTVAAHAAEGVHLNEIDGPVGPTAQFLHLDVKGKLAV